MAKKNETPKINTIDEFNSRVEIIEVLSENKNYEKLACLVDWGNNGEKKLDIRTWVIDEKEDKVIPMKGVTLSFEELQILLSSIDKFEDLDF